MAYSFTVDGGYGAKVSVTERDSVGASDHPVLVHDTELLFTAHFHRAGPDLVLQGHDGRQLFEARDSAQRQQHRGAHLFNGARTVRFTIDPVRSARIRKLLAPPF